MNKTLLVTTAHLDNPKYYDKTIKFIEHYKRHYSDIVIIDNASLKEYKIDGAKIYTQFPFFDRTAHLEYLFVWRALYSCRNFFLLGYDRVIYANNDFYCLSDKMFEWVNTVEGFASPWCSRHNFAEADIMVITKDCKEYLDFVKDGYFWKHNGKHLEQVVPLTTINKDLVGNRHSEYMNNIPEGSDYTSQLPLEWKLP